MKSLILGICSLHREQRFQQLYGELFTPGPGLDELAKPDTIICRCERVTLAEIKAVIQTGVRDMNEIKALTRAGMGACGGKTCNSLIKRAFSELGVPLEEVTDNVHRPLFVEVPLGVLAGAQE